MNKHYKTLELHKIMDMLAEQAGNDETLRMISELEPVTDIDKVRAELKKTEDAFDLSVKYGTPPFYRFKDIRGSLQRAQSGSIRPMSWCYHHWSALRNRGHSQCLPIA